MKSFILNSIKSLILASIVLVGVGFVAAEWAPAPGNPPAGNPPTFLNIGSDAQYKIGPLAIGRNSAPTGTLQAQVIGQTIANQLFVRGSGVVNKKIGVGGGASGLDATSDADFQVLGNGDIIVSSLAGSGIRNVCATETGVLYICGGAPEEICGNGVDDDNDGEIDENCATECPVLPAPGDFAQCQDGRCLPECSTANDCTALLAGSGLDIDPSSLTSSCVSNSCVFTPTDLSCPASSVVYVDYRYSASFEDDTWVEQTCVTGNTSGQETCGDIVLGSVSGGEDFVVTVYTYDPNFDLSDVFVEVTGAYLKEVSLPEVGASYDYPVRRVYRATQTSSSNPVSQISRGDIDIEIVVDNRGGGTISPRVISDSVRVPVQVSGQGSSDTNTISKSYAIQKFEN